MPQGRSTASQSSTLAVVAAMRQDLARSGLDRKEVITALQLEVVTAEEGMARYGIRRTGYRIPYFDLESKRDDDFHRIRWLSAGGSLTEKVPPKYHQLPGTPPRLYLPPVVKWDKIAAAPTIPIWITEGEKKACAATLAKTATVGLGGVWSWTSKTFAFDSLPDFDWFQWSGRTVVIAFDSDVALKPGVRQASHALALMLTKRGARVEMATLQKLHGQNCGLDDLIVAKGAQALEMVPRQAYGPCEELWHLNEQYAFVAQLNGGVMDLNTIVDGSTIPHIYTRETYIALHASRTFTLPLHDGTVSKPKKIADAWLNWGHRLTYRKIVFKPGADEKLGDDLNLWRPNPIEPLEPKHNQLTPYYKLRDHIFRKEPGLIPWFEAWVGLPLVHPGLKHRTAVMIHGQKQGTGKTLLGSLIGGLYHGPPSYVVLNGHQMTDRFNGWAMRALFVLGDELVPDDKRQFADQIKAYITGNELTVEQKFLPSFPIENHMNFYMTSNHPNALYLATDDRRFTVLETPSERLADSLYDTLYGWALSLNGNGLRYLMWHFATQVDLAACNPTAVAPWSEAKHLMQHTSLSGIQRWIADLIANPDGMLVAMDHTPLPGDIWRSRDLADVFDPAASGREKHTLSTALGVALREVGAPYLLLQNYKNGPFYLLRNAQEWMQKPPIEVWRHYSMTQMGITPAPQPVRAVNKKKA